MKKLSLLCTVFSFLGASTVFAQDTDEQSHNVSITFPEIALMDIESTNNSNVSFQLNASGVEAGQEYVIDEENQDLWINYTSVVADNSSDRSITVVAASVPSIEGLTLRVVAGPHIGSGGGELGTPTSVVTPSTNPVEIITNIGSSYTGNGNSNGHNLTYYLDYSGDFENLNVSDAGSTISLTYTITE
jgi:hypothetical protein